MFVVWVCALDNVLTALNCSCNDLCTPCASVWLWPVKIQPHPVCTTDLNLTCMVVGYFE